MKMATFACADVSGCGIQLGVLRKAHDEELAMSRHALERGDKHAADTHTNTAAKVWCFLQGIPRLFCGDTVWHSQLRSDMEKVTLASNTPNHLPPVWHTAVVETRTEVINPTLKPEDIEITVGTAHNLVIPGETSVTAVVSYTLTMHADVATGTTREFGLRDG